jgi:hypothetical protein
MELISNMNENIQKFVNLQNLKIKNIKNQKKGNNLYLDKENFK